MTKTLLLDPHGDDVALFASFLALREKATVHVLKPTVPIPEIESAYSALGVDLLIGLPLARDYDRVIPPAWQQEGHADHNAVAEHAYAAWPIASLSGYLTYAPRGQRSRGGSEVVPEPWMIAKKLAALACYESQIIQDSTRPWFFDLLDMREWLA